MNDIENPTINEIIEWAYSDEDWPNVDWPLFISWKDDLKLYIELILDEKSQKKDFFTFMLYYQVGKVYKKKNGEYKIRQYLEYAANIDNNNIVKWVKDVNKLLKNPHLFNYYDWCDGGLTKYNLRKSGERPTRP